MDKEYFDIAYDLPSDIQFHFAIRINKNWRLVKLNVIEPTENKPGSKIALLKRIENPVAEIDVEAFLSPRDIHPVDYFELWLEQQTIEIINKKTYSSDYGFISDYQYRVYIEEKTFVCRSLTIKDGNRIFIITCRIENSINELVEEEFSTALQSFRLLNPSNEIFAESYYDFYVELPIKLGFAIPVSWVVKEDEFLIPNGTSVNFKYFDEEDQVKGSISFVAASKKVEPYHEDLYLYYLNKLKDNGVEFDDTDLSTIETEGSNQQWIAVIPSTINGNNYEIVVSILEQLDTIIFIALIGPAKSNDHINWAFNKKVMYNITETLRLVE